MKRILALIGALLVATSTAAQNAPQYSELHPAQPLVADDEGKIEVVEFFWYGCPHCFDLEPLVEKWKNTLPRGAVFRPYPAVFNAQWANDASIFFTFEALGVLDKLHRPFFDAIHVDHLRTNDPAALDAWVKKQGIDPKKFEATRNSFSVQAKTRRAAQLTAAYKIDGTPAFAVNGRYTVSVEQGRSFEGMMRTVSDLVDMIDKGK